MNNSEDKRVVCCDYERCSHCYKVYASGEGEIRGIQVKYWDFKGNLRWQDVTDTCRNCRLHLMGKFRFMKSDVSNVNEGR